MIVLKDGQTYVWTRECFGWQKNEQEDEVNDLDSFSFSRNGPTSLC
jgi:hypothetical protein